MVKKLKAVNLDPILHYALKKMANHKDTSITNLITVAVLEHYKNELIEWITLAEAKHGRQYTRKG